MKEIGDLPKIQSFVLYYQDLIACAGLYQK